MSESPTAEQIANDIAASLNSGKPRAPIAPDGRPLAVAPTEGEPESAAPAPIQPEPAVSPEEAPLPEEALQPDPESDAPEVEEQPPGSEIAFTFFDRDSGDEINVSLEEARNGYLRQQDYTRKTQTLAQEKKALEGQRAEVTGRVAKLNETISALEAAQNGGGSPFHGMTQQQIMELRETDPGRFSVLFLQHQEHERLVAEAKQQVEQANAQVAAEEIPRERALLGEKAPEFAGDRFDAAYQDLGLWALSEGGLSPDEWNDMRDHRYLWHLRNSRKYLEMTRSAPKARKKVEGSRRTLRPGAAGSSDPGEAAGRAEAAALKQLQDTGSVDAFAAAYSARRAAGRSKIIK